MLTMLISGPRQPGNDIDVFLRPLIDDLKMLWNEGVETYDAYRSETFCLKAMLFCTINDFPAYGNLSGYGVKGHYACPICQENTSFCQLKHCRKTVYLGHRRFLPRDHHYRKLKKAFNGLTENVVAPAPSTGVEIYEKVKNLNVTYGKLSNKPSKRQRQNIESPQICGFKRISVFYDLPYWKLLYVRHCLDVMHIEKNVCDSLVSTLLNVQGKSKDGHKARLDLVEMGIRPELAPQQRGSRTFLPPASHTLSKKEKKDFLTFLEGVKVPDGYCSNFRSLVSMNELKLIGMKSHDHHILMQQFLPVALRAILPKQVRHAIIRLCLFFSGICNKVIDPEMLNQMQKEIVITLCQLEMYFPPSFFDIMVHLTVHLVNEVKLCGPVYLRWMYPFERYMKVLKGYVKNHNRPEGCIAERYITEEASELCSSYLSGVYSIGIPTSKDNDRLDGVGTIGGKLVRMPRELWQMAHLYVLHNDVDVQPYVEKHMDILRNANRLRTETWITNEHNRTFIQWFKEKIQSQLSSTPFEISDKLRWLCFRPSIDVYTYMGYRINGYLFYTKE